MPVVSVSISQSLYLECVRRAETEGVSVPAVIRRCAETLLNIPHEIGHPRAGRPQVRDNPTPDLAVMWRAQGWVECPDGRWRPGPGMPGASFVPPAAPTPAQAPQAIQAQARGALGGALPEGWTVNERGDWVAPGGG